MSRLEQQLDSSEDSFRNVSTFLLLLSSFPGDMEPLFQQDMVVFFTTQVPVVDKLRQRPLCHVLNLHVVMHPTQVITRTAPGLLQAYNSCLSRTCCLAPLHFCLQLTR